MGAQENTSADSQPTRRSSLKKDRPVTWSASSARHEKRTSISNGSFLRKSADSRRTSSVGSDHRWRSVSEDSGRSRPQTPWDCFTDELRQMQECSGDYAFSVCRGQLSEIHGSNIFHQVMDDMQQAPDIDTVFEVEEPISKMDKNFHVTFQETDEDKDEKNVDGQAPGPEDYRSKVKAAGQRAWRIIRRNLNEVTMQKRKAAVSMNWAILKHAISQVTDMERGRQVLYERYIDKPDQWLDGFSRFPQHLIKPTKDGRIRLYSNEELAMKNGDSKPKKRAKSAKRKTPNTGNISTDSL